MSPRTMLDLNPGLVLGKPMFESKGPPITMTAKDKERETSANSKASTVAEKSFL